MDDKMKTFTYNDTDVPVVLLNLATPTQKIFTEILDKNHKFLGINKIFYDLPFSKVPFPLYWDGLIYDPNNNNDEGKIAPNYIYILKVNVLRLFGDSNNKEEYETWVSPKFRIKRIDNVTGT